MHTIEQEVREVCGVGGEAGCGGGWLLVVCLTCCATENVL